MVGWCVKQSKHTYNWPRVSLWFFGRATSDPSSWTVFKAGASAVLYHFYHFYQFISESLHRKKVDATASEYQHTETYCFVSENVAEELTGRWASVPTRVNNP